MSCVILQYEPMYVVSVPVGAVAIAVGDFIDYTSEAAVLMDAATEDTDFFGISMGKVAASSTGDFIPVATKCICEVTLTSATYTFGEMLKYTSANTLVTTTAGAAGIAWFIDGEKVGDTITSGRVLFDVLALSSAGTTVKIFETPAA